MVDGCTTGWIWASAASERSDTTPTSSSPSTIGRCRYGLSERSAKASCTESVGAAQSGDSVIHSLTLRSEEHTSELQSLMRISYAVFCLKKKNNTLNKQSIYNFH